jgi:hypothetical protein
MDQQVIPTTQIFANKQHHQQPSKLGVAHVNRQTAHFQNMRPNPKQVFPSKTAWTGATWKKIVLDLTRGQRGTNV